jgi:Xaa-Pro aminopeptidase
VIEEGDSVVIDFGGKRDGYCSDVTRTFTVGPASSRLIEVHAVVREANRVARAAVRPGVPADAVDRAARTVISDAGYGEFFIHRTGHGIGLDGHEHPYLVAGNAELLEPGMAFSIEPGIYLPGEFGVRIEDICVATADGIEVLNQADRHLIEVE